MTIRKDSSAHDTSSRSAPEIALRIADRLAAIPGIAAVAMGGSRARGEGDILSDLDLGLYYHDDAPPDTAALSRLAQELDDSGAGDLVVAPGEWGPWIDGGAWLTVDGRRVDWIYRNIERVSVTIAECLQGITTCHYQPGHPHGFHTHIYMGEVHHAAALHDPTGVLTSLQIHTAPYPAPLKRTIIARYVWEAEFALDCSRTAAARGDVAYVSGNLWRCVACLLQVLFAANECYFLNEKGAVAAIDRMPIRPDTFATTVKQVQGATGATAEELTAHVGQMRGLTSAVRDLVSA